MIGSRWQHCSTTGLLLEDPRHPEGSEGEDFEGKQDPTWELVAVVPFASYSVRGDQRAIYLWKRERDANWTPAYKEIE